MGGVEADAVEDLEEAVVEVDGVGASEEEEVEVDVDLEVRPFFNFLQFLSGLSCCGCTNSCVFTCRWEMIRQRWAHFALLLQV